VPFVSNRETGRPTVERDGDEDGEAMDANRRELPARSRTWESAEHRMTP
jgi:hypothetical protein